MTDTARGAKDRGFSVAVIRVLDCLWWRGHPVFAYVFALVSLVLLHGHEYLIPIDSDEFCSDEAMKARVSWLIPKVREDCVLIATTLKLHAYRNAAIVLDVWTFFCFIASFVIGIISFMMNVPSYVNTWAKPLGPNHGCPRRIFIAFIFIVINVMLYFFVFHFSILSTGGRLMYMDTLWGHGLGVMFQTIAVGSCAATFAGIMSVAIRCVRTSMEK